MCRPILRTLRLYPNWDGGFSNHVRVAFMAPLVHNRPRPGRRDEPFIRNAISRDKSVQEPIVRRPAHPGRASRHRPGRRQASGVGKLISVPRPKVTAAERQVQLAHPPVLVDHIDDRIDSGCCRGCAAGVTTPPLWLQLSHGFHPGGDDPGCCGGCAEEGDRPCAWMGNADLACVIPCGVNELNFQINALVLLF